MAEKDYSSTPLSKKLGIRPGARVALVGAPAGFDNTLAPLPDGVRLASGARGAVDVAVLFVTRLSDLERRSARLVRALAPDGGLWFAWPTKASKVATELTFEIVQRVGLDAGLVDNKSASLGSPGDAGFGWQGLRFVYRLKDRPGRAPTNRG